MEMKPLLTKKHQSKELMTGSLLQVTYLHLTYTFLLERVCQGNKILEQLYTKEKWSKSTI